MKNEDKLIELLAEYLKKTDQAIERIDKVQGRLEIHSVQFEKHAQQLEKHAQQLEKHAQQLEKHAQQFEKHSEELIALRKESLKREIQQEALLKEIFSISKRVGTLEERK